MPELERVAFTEPDTNGRVWDGGPVTIHCDSGYEYGNSTTSIDRCFADEEKSGFAEGCTLICEEVRTRSSAPPQSYYPMFQ